jgi:hypothetical protein
MILAHPTTVQLQSYGRIIQQKQWLPRYGVTPFGAFGREKWSAWWLGLKLPTECPLSGVKRTFNFRFLSPKRRPPRAIAVAGRLCPFDLD